MSNNQREVSKGGSKRLRAIFSALPTPSSVRSVSLQGPTPDVAVPQGIAGNAVVSSRITIRKLTLGRANGTIRKSNARLADLKASIMRDWRNGRRARLRIWCLRRVGSSPTSRTKGLIHGLPFNYHLRTLRKKTVDRYVACGNRPYKNKLRRRKGRVHALVGCLFRQIGRASCRERV